MKILAVFVALLLSEFSHAGFKHFDAGKIVGIYGGYDHGNVYFIVENDVPNPAGCSATSSQRRMLGFDATKTNTDHALSLLLAAKAADMTVEIRIYDDSCVSSHVSVNRIAIF